MKCLFATGDVTVSSRQRIVTAVITAKYNIHNAIAFIQRIFIFIINRSGRDDFVLLLRYHGNAF